MAATLLGQESGGVLVRSFLIALVLVAPIALWQWRRLRAGPPRSGDATSIGVTQPATDDFRNGDAGGATSQEPGAGSLETLVDTIAERASSAVAGEMVHFEVPAGLLLEGGPANDELIEPILRDALHRSGFDVVTCHPRPSGGQVGLRFECRRR